MTLIFVLSILLTILLTAGITFFMIKKFDTKPILNEIFKGIERPTGSNMLITTETALEMIKAYQESRNDNDSISGHIKWCELKNYLTHIESELSSREKRISGVEFFFAKYPDDHPNRNKGKTTIVFFPTIFDGTYHTPIATTRNNGFLPIYSASATSETIFSPFILAATITPQFELSAGNRSQMSPPRYP